MKGRPLFRRQIFPPPQHLRNLSAFFRVRDDMVIFVAICFLRSPHVGLFRPSPSNLAGGRAGRTLVLRFSNRFEGGMGERERANDQAPFLNFTGSFHEGIFRPAPKSSVHTTGGSNASTQVLRFSAGCEDVSIAHIRLDFIELNIFSTNIG